MTEFLFCLFHYYSIGCAKLQQIFTNLLTAKNCVCIKTPVLSTLCMIFPVRTKNLKNKLRKLPETPMFSTLSTHNPVSGETPSPYGRECPYGGNSPRSRVLWLLISSFPTTKQEVSMEKTNQPILLSLDLGTATGWALSNKHGRIMSGTAHFRPRRFEGGGMRYLRFERWLNETRDVSGEINAVYFEEVRRHLGVDAAHAYGGFLASLTAWCEEHSIPYEGVPVGTIKKFITGKGNAGKAAVIAAVKALGHQPEDDNEADALALLHFAREQMIGGQP